MYIYWYAVIVKPTKEEADAGATPKMVIEPTPTLARDTDHVRMIAVRELNNDAASALDRVEIIVRPF